MGAFDSAEFMEFNNGVPPYISAENLLLLQKTMMLCAHPVGSYYWSSNNTDPSELFGGTWTQIKDRFVYALGDSGSAGDTGGASSRAIAESNLPKMEGDIGMHNGATATTVQTVTGKFTSKQNCPKYFAQGEGASGASSIGILHWEIGQANPTELNTMPPYIKAYCWRRTA